MILVTVGTQLPFDRLVGAVAQWARVQQRHDVVFQTASGAVSLEGFRHERFFPAAEMAELMQRADLVVAHAGMGTILTCLGLGRPLVAMPRIASQGEHRNDHQVATARKFEDRPGVFIAWHESQLPDLIQRADGLSIASSIAPTASRELLDAVRAFIVEQQGAPR